MKFKKDQNLWLKWYAAKKRFGRIVLNHILKSNHIHLIAEDNGKGDVIPKSMQLFAGRMAQEYNQKMSNWKGIVNGQRALQLEANHLWKRFIES